MVTNSQKTAIRANAVRIASVASMASSPSIRLLGVLMTVSVLSATMLGCVARAGSAREHLEIGLVVGRRVDPIASLTSIESIEDRACPVRQDLSPVVRRGPLGNESSYWIDPESRLGINARPEAVWLSRLPTLAASGQPAGAPEPRLVAVRARFPDEEHRALVEYREKHRACTVLVAVAGQTEWVDPNGSDWSTRIPIGVYREGAAFLSALLDERDGGRMQVEWADWPEAVAAQRVTRDSERRGLEALACDGEFRAEFEQENPGAVELLRAELSRVECP